jgi:hypothetical protein
VFELCTSCCQLSAHAQMAGFEHDIDTLREPIVITDNRLFEPLMPLLCYIVFIISEPLHVRVETTAFVVQLTLHYIPFDIVPLSPLIALCDSYLGHCLA